jgi:dolichol kinase
VLLAAELKRKSIHLSSVAIPLAYFFTPDSWQKGWERGLLALVIVSLAIEVFRLNHPRTRHVFQHFFGELLRNHEDASLLGSTYLLIACLLTIHLFPKDVAVLRSVLDPRGHGGRDRGEVDRPGPDVREDA